MYSPSHVLYKQFLPGQRQEKEQKMTNYSPTLSRITIKNIIRQIHKNKVQLGSPKKDGSQSHKKYASLEPYFNSPHRRILSKRTSHQTLEQYSSQRQGRLNSPAQFVDNKVAIVLHEPVPVIKKSKERKERTTLKIMPKHSINKKSASLKLSEHRQSQHLKLDFTLFDRMEKSRSLKNSYTGPIEGETNKDFGIPRIRSNIFRADGIKTIMRSGREENQSRTISRVATQKTHRMRIGNTQLQLTLSESKEKLPKDLQASKIIFQRKNNLRKQFLINIRKLKKLSKEEEQEEHLSKTCLKHQAHSRLERSEQKTRKNQTFHINAKVKTEGRDSFLKKKKNNEKVKQKLDQIDFMDEAIEPW